MQRHHGALRESDQRRRLVGESALGQLAVDEGVEQGGGGPRRGGLAGEVDPFEPEPLAAEADLAGERRIGRNEGAVRQRLGPIGRQPEQVLSVGAIAVQQHHQPARPAAGSGRSAMGGERQRGEAHGRVLVRGGLV